MFRLPSRPPAFLTPPLLAPPPPFTHPRTLRQRRWLPPMLPTLPTGYSRQSSSRGFRRGCRSRPATPSQAPPPPALPFHRPPPRQHPVSAGWVYPSVQRWLARLSRCETSRVALCARSPAASPSGAGANSSRALTARPLFGAEAVLFQAVTAVMHLPVAGPSGSGVGTMPDPTQLPMLPTFTPAGGSISGLDVLATAALFQPGPQGTQATPNLTQSESQGPQPAVRAAQLHTPGPYNPAAALPPKVVKRILALEFVEMSELRADVWPEDPAPSSTPRRPGRPPVINIKTWLECFARMAAVLVSRFPEKGPELWAYQSTILNAAHSYDGATWVAYDRQYRREMLARKDLNWSVPNSRLYNEAFTGRARIMPRCQHCLSEDHGSAGCPQHPNPVVLGWFQHPGALQPSTQPTGLQTSTAPTPPHAKGSGQDVCRNFNSGRCRFSRCRFLHACSDCSGSHAALHCPQRLGGAPRPAGPRSRPPARARYDPPHPYLPPAQNSGSA